jgi:poly-gamma-glutamate capsule biosynthesis protein CapA/YwtB (metallophosphatase superfamily)
VGWIKRISIARVCLYLLVLATACSNSQLAETSTEDMSLQSTTRVPTYTFTSSPQPSPTRTNTPTPTGKPYTALLFTGVIVPARCVQAGIDERGDPHYLYNNVRDIIIQADIAVGMLNATISDATRHEGCVKSWEMVGGAENADALRRAGFDVMGVATNHIKDCGWPPCGDMAFLDTLDNLQRVNIITVGAGSNLKEAMQPVVVEVNGIRFGFVSLGEVATHERIFANDDTPGIAMLTEDNLRESIQNAMEVSDVVIVMPHSGPEDFIDPSSTQRKWARVSVDAGADLVVMNHAHVVQAYREINGVLVFFGLGNFVFDQIWARDHQQGVILMVTFQGTTVADFEMIPTVVDQDGTVHIADEEEAAEIINRILEANEKLE